LRGQPFQLIAHFGRRARIEARHADVSGVVFEHLRNHRDVLDHHAIQHNLLGLAPRLAHHPQDHGAAGVARQHAIHLHDRKLARGGVADAVDQVCRLDAGFIRRTAGKHRNHRRVAVALGNVKPDVGRSGIGMGQVILELFGCEVGAERVQRFEHASDRAVGHLMKVRLRNVLAADARQHFLVNAQVAISLIA